MKTGLLGGTFNPIHKGHLILAENAKKCCKLDEVIFIPAASPPHKKKCSVAPFADRVGMVKLATGDYPYIRVSTVEKKLPPPSYTIDMFPILQEKEKPGKSYYFIVGADAFLDIPTWKGYEDLLAQLHFIVIERPGFNNNKVREWLLQHDYYKTHTYWINRKSRKKVWSLVCEMPDISSSQIRRRIGRGEDIADLVLPKIKEYIEKNRLYK